MRILGLELRCMPLPTLLVLAAYGCCDLQDPAYFVGELDAGGGIYYVRWFQSNEANGLQNAVVNCYRWAPPDVPSPPIYELYGPDGVIDMPVGVSRDLPGDSDVCGSYDRVEYGLGNPSPGSYLLVHRLSSVPSDVHLTGDAGGVTIFDGEEALVATLVFR